MFIHSRFGAMPPSVQSSDMSCGRKRIGSATRGMGTTAVADRITTAIAIELRT